MKKVVMLTVFILLLSGVDALSSTMEDSYQPKETIIAQLSQDIIGTINPDQMNLLRNGHIDVGFEYGIKKLQVSHYFWLIAPENTGNYTLRIEDVVANVGGTPEVVDFEQTIEIVGDAAEYSIQPGAISTSSDFQITVELYDDFSKNIQTNFPEERSVTIFPGATNIKYEVDNIFGIQFLNIVLGDYSFPALITRPENICGDGIISGDEICDGEELLGVTCESLNASYIGGNLSCSNDCFSYNESQCVVEEDDEEPIVYVCGEDYLEFCDVEDDCLDFDGYWYDDSCHKFEQGVVCDETHRELCEGPEQCIGANGYWYDNVCNDEKEIVVGTPEFSFVPKEMNLTIFTGGQLPSYTFIIKNTGSVPIENLALDYSQVKFTITPSNNISLDVNESVDFVLGIAGNVRGEVQGAIVASTDEISEYMLVTMRSTENQAEARTDYGGGAGGYMCAELNGIECDSGEVCSSSVINAIDTGSCCTGTCQEAGGGGSGGSKAWIGYLIAGIIVVGGLIVFLKYKKTGSGGSPTKQRFAMAEKRLP